MDVSMYCFAIATKTESTRVQQHLEIWSAYNSKIFSKILTKMAAKEPTFSKRLCHLHGQQKLRKLAIQNFNV